MYKIRQFLLDLGFIDIYGSSDYHMYLSEFQYRNKIFIKVRDTYYELFINIKNFTYSCGIKNYEYIPIRFEDSENFKSIVKLLIECPEIKKEIRDGKIEKILN